MTTVEQINQPECAKMMRAVREENGLSRIDVAAAAGISASYLFDLEGGNRGWSRALIESVTEAMRKCCKPKALKMAGPKEGK